MPTTPMRPTGRTKARRRAVDVLFEADQRGQYDPEHLRGLLRERLAVSAAQTALPQFSADIVEGVIEHLQGIDETISTYLRGWTLRRLPSVDRAILRAATWELLYSEDVDAPVVISEAVRLAEQLAGDQSPAFVNSVLDRLRVLAPALREDIAESERMREARQARAERERPERDARQSEESDDSAGFAEDYPDDLDEETEPTEISEDPRGRGGAGAD